MFGSDKGFSENDVDGDGVVSIGEFQHIKMLRLKHMNEFQANKMSRLKSVKHESPYEREMGVRGGNSMINSIVKTVGQVSAQTKQAAPAVPAVGNMVQAGVQLATQAAGSMGRIIHQTKANASPQA